MDRILPRNAPDLPAGDLGGSLDVSALSLLKRRLLVLGTRWPTLGRFPPFGMTHYRRSGGSHLIYLISRPPEMFLPGRQTARS